MSSKPIGGVNRVILRVASHSGATTSQTNDVELALLEDGSTYTQNTSWLASTPIVTHTLTIKTPIECDITLIDELHEALYWGFNATLHMGCGDSIELFDSGSSALYLKESRVDYGATPLERPSRVWVLEANNNYQI